MTKRKTEEREKDHLIGNAGETRGMKSSNKRREMTREIEEISTLVFLEIKMEKMEERGGKTEKLMRRKETVTIVHFVCMLVWV